MPTTSIKLAHPWQGNPVGAEVTVDEAVARHLVRGGIAAAAEVPPAEPAPARKPRRARSRRPAGEDTPAEATAGEAEEV